MPANSTTLPPPNGKMFQFYEGLDSNKFTESTGGNHNSAPNWLKIELLRHLDFLSYILDVVNDQTKLSEDIVHTESILDNQVTTPKLHSTVRDILTGVTDNQSNWSEVYTWYKLMTTADQDNTINTISELLDAFSGSAQDIDIAAELLKLKVNPDWNETNSSKQAYIKNKPAPYVPPEPTTPQVVPIPATDVTAKLALHDNTSYITPAILRDWGGRYQKKALSSASLFMDSTASSGKIQFRFGQVVSRTDHNETHYFESGFTNRCLVCVCSSSSSLNSFYGHGLIAFSRRNFTLNRDDRISGDGLPSTTSLTYIAIGY